MTTAQGWIFVVEIGIVTAVYVATWLGKKP